MRACLTTAARAAWGAQARILGAPAIFKYIPAAPLKKMFWGDAAGIPADAIYVLDELDLDQRREYEESALYGWKEANRWLNNGQDKQDYEVLVAMFYQACKQSLATLPRRQDPSALPQTR